MARRSKKAAKKSETAFEKFTKALRSLRWQVVSIIYFYRLLSRVVEGAYQSMIEAAEQMEKRAGIRALATAYNVSTNEIVKSIRSASNNTITAYEAMEAAQQALLIDHGRFAEKYGELWKAARVAAVVSGQEINEVFAAFVEALTTGEGAVVDNLVSVYQLQGALEEHARTLGVEASSLDRATRERIIYNRIQQVSNELLAAGADEALKQQEAMKRVATEWKALRTTVGELVRPKGGLNLVADLLLTINRLLIMGAVGAEAFQKAFAPITGGRPEEALIRLITQPEKTYERYVEAYREAFSRYLDALEGVQAESDRQFRMPEMFDPDKTQDAMDKSLDRIIEHFLEREDLIQKYLDREAEIWQDYYDAIEDAEIRFQRRVRDIHIDAARDRAKAIRDYEFEARQERRKNQEEEKNDLEKHLMDMRHRREMFRLRELNNEAMYLYERSRLIAEGDVLALEDLDARFKLERDAREKEFDLSQRQREEEFQLEQRQKRQQYQEDLRDLKEQLERELEEIAIRERERLEDARQRRADDREDALRNRERMLRDEKQHLDQSMRQWAQYWEQLSRRTELGAGKIAQILRAYFGPGGEADKVLQQYTMRWRSSQYILRSITGGNRTGWGNIPEGWQFGGSFIANRDSLIRIGEHQPELLQAIPLSPLAGTLNLRWQGGPIPIQGSGVSGMDVATLGDTIAQGIVIELGRHLAWRP